CDLPFSTWAECIGRASGYSDPYAHLEAQLGRPIERAALRASRRRRFLELVEAQPILPGVEAYIGEGKRLGLMLRVASSGGADWVVGHLPRLGLIDHFDCVRCAEHVGAAKPDPALYRAALESLGVRADEAIAFEDSPNGVLAAKRAGIFCVAVPNTLTRQLPL